jgi:hypothetical protein
MAGKAFDMFSALTERYSHRMEVHGVLATL